MQYEAAPHGPARALVFVIVGSGAASDAPERAIPANRHCWERCEQKGESVESESLCCSRKDRESYEGVCRWGVPAGGGGEEVG